MDQGIWGIMKYREYFIKDAGSFEDYIRVSTESPSRGTVFAIKTGQKMICRDPHYPFAIQKESTEL